MTVNNYKLSPAGEQHIKGFEAAGGKPCLTAYKCPADKQTIGYGHTGPDVTKGMKITAGYAETLFRKDIAPVEKWVNNNVKVKITQGQFDAIVDLAFNVGIGSVEKSILMRMLNSGNLIGAGIQLLRWVYSAGKELPGLVKRRKAALEMWNQK
jgi:lysozyme